MADTFEEIYRNASLGSTQLDDGEETILTTNSSTRYVIKDMYVNGTSDLKDTYLELNGFNVGNITQNQTGSLIIPPNSTLKLKTTDYPFTILENIYSASNSTDIGVYINYVRTDGTVEKVELDHYYSGYSQANNWIDTNYSTASNGDKYIHTTHNDGNSSQQVRYQNLDNYSHSNTTSQTYRPFGFIDNKLFYMDNSALKFSDLTTNPAGNSGTAFSGTGLKNNNSYSPFTTSSYPRGKGAHGFFWFVPSSGYTTSIFGIKVSGTNTGSMVRLNFTQTHTMSSNNGNFTISLDEANDEMVVWRHQDSSNFHRSIFTWSTIKNTNSSSTTTYTPSSEISYSNTNHALGNMAQASMHYLYGGGFSWRNSTSELVQSAKDFTEISKTNIWVGSNASNNLNSPNNNYNLKQREISNSEMTALGISAPTFGIALYGIKST